MVLNSMTLYLYNDYVIIILLLRIEFDMTGIKFKGVRDSCALLQHTCMNLTVECRGTYSKYVYCMYGFIRVEALGSNHEKHE